MDDLFNSFFNEKPVKRLWCRVDDICENNSSFQRLMEIYDKTPIPMTLAVIPEKLTPDCQKEISLRPGWTVVQHGYSHENYGSSEKPSELGGARPIIETVDDLLAGKLLLKTLFPKQFYPLLVPPWHSISLPLLTQMTDLGYRGISLNVRQKFFVPSPLLRLDVHIDPLVWKPSPHFKDPQKIASEMDLFSKTSMLGIVAHPHRHDEECWDFFESLFGLSAENCEWFHLLAHLKESI